MNKQKIIIITGATGSGKSKIAINFAKENNGEIINADSMQIYKQIPILSAQPNKKDQQNINHYLYGFLDITKNNNYSVGKYLIDLNKTIDCIVKNNKIPIIVGGTMLYIDTIINGISEINDIDEKLKLNINNEFKNKTTEEIFLYLQSIDDKYSKIVDKNNKVRLIRGIEVKLSTGKSIVDFWNKKNNLFNKKFTFDKYITTIDRNLLYNNINKRFDEMIKYGVIEEVNLLYEYCKKNNINIQKLPKAIGLHEFFKYFNNDISLNDAIEKSKQLSRNYAKRQLTWFRNRFKDFKQIIV